MVLASKSFSIVIPTYTGAKTIGRTFDSILKQKFSATGIELIIVIDGPSDTLRKAIEGYRQKFIQQDINLKLYQLETNQGRFEARLLGARAAKNKNLLFIDDRVQIAEGSLSYLESTKEKVVMASVTELPSKNIISKTLHIFRRKIYGRYWGLGSKDYYIDQKNFESSPKGTTSLYIDKQLFLDACKKVQQDSGNSRFINEDTKVLKAVVDKGIKIFRTNKINVLYQPREEFWTAAKHLYGRGPRFVDYYYKPGTRFFPLLIAIYIVFAVAVILAIFKPLWLMYASAAAIFFYLILPLFLARNLKEYLIVTIGMPIVTICFVVGVLRGSVLKLISARA